MVNVLEITYRRMSPWGLPIRAAIQATPVLRTRDTWWSEGPLSDLAFAIATRLTYLPEIIALVDENINALDAELRGKDVEIDRLLQQGITYAFQNERAVRRLLIGVSSFITECRSCFENLARFYREFLSNYFDESIAIEQSYDAIARMAPTTQWVEDLKRVRHDLLHQRSLWPAFEVRPERSPRYEPLLLLNWRPGMFQPDDCVSFQMLRDIRSGLAGAAVAVEQALVARVRSGK